MLVAGAADGYALLTDVNGVTPVNPDGDQREVQLRAGYNTEIEHRERFRYVRNRSVFIGGYDELPYARFGPGLPRIRDWSARWFSSVPYVVPFDPAALPRSSALLRRLGYGTGFPLHVAAVRGTAVGRDLLALTAEAFALVRKEQTGARMLMVTGPRLHPGELPDVEGLDKRDYYRAGKQDYAKTTPADLADAMRRAFGQRPTYRRVRKDGAANAANQLASLLQS
ncbi:MAG TPA: hypothetical protein VGN54_01365 [Mycobacteriales bacterium]|jgi:hypothetical protein|nr:hypothetical protein [Mycobacteriales bacterium]